MKALLLKDAYQLKAYCKSMLLVVGVFGVVSVFSQDNLFFFAYPIIMMGLLPVSMLSYDERSHWNDFCGCLPVSRAVIVGEKYLLGLLLVVPTAVLLTALRGLGTAIAGNFDLVGLTQLGGLTLALGLLSIELCMPFFFKFGVEKGRIVYYVAICVFVAASFAVKTLPLMPTLATPAVVALAALGYAVSWSVSVKMYGIHESPLLPGEGGTP